MCACYQDQVSERDRQIDTETKRRDKGLTRDRDRERSLHVKRESDYTREIYERGEK